MILSALMYGLTLTLKNEIVQIAPKGNQLTPLACITPINDDPGRVNTIAPGWVRTPMAEEALKDPEVVYRALATYVLSSFRTNRFNLSCIELRSRKLAPHMI
jgi:hypothetical protein